MPKYICKLCQEDLENAHEFRTRCITAQEYFNSVDFDGGKDSDSLEIKNEIPALDELNIAENFCTSELEIKDELPIEETNIGEFCFVKTESKDVLEETDFRRTANDDDIGSICSNNCSGSNFSEEISDELKPLETSPIIKPDPATVAPRVKRQYRKRVKDPDAELKKREDKLKKATLKKLKTENDKIFICDQCGSYFNCKTNFLTHQRRHAGDKAFQCE